MEYAFQVAIILFIYPTTLAMSVVLTLNMLRDVPWIQSLDFPQKAHISAILYLKAWQLPVSISVAQHKGYQHHWYSQAQACTGTCPGNFFYYNSVHIYD